MIALTLLDVRAQLDIAGTGAQPLGGRLYVGRVVLEEFHELVAAGATPILGRHERIGTIVIAAPHGLRVAAQRVARPRRGRAGAGGRRQQPQEAAPERCAGPLGSSCMTPTIRLPPRCAAEIAPPDSPRPPPPLTRRGTRV